MATAFRRTSSDLAGDPISLTLTHVSAVPKRNNEQYIAIYLRGQSALLKQWALDGAKEAASWGTPPADTDNNAASKAAEDGFSSPILKARVPEKNEKASERPGASQQTKSRKALADETRNNHAATKERRSKLHETKAIEPDKPHHKDVRDTAQKSKNTRKRAVATHSDSEVEKRRSERRERKRLKRDIISLEVSESESQVEAKKGKKARKASGKIPTGFALMHGFSATNVGKHRLTLDRILQNTGVFGKGKASFAAKVVKNGKPGVFSESDFLKKGSRSVTKMKGRQPSKSPSLSSPCSSSSSSSSVRHKHKIEKRQKKRRRSRSSAVSPEAPVEESQHSTMSTATAAQRDRPAYDPANSIVWDIEKDSHVSGSASKIGTILVKVPHTLRQEKANPLSGLAKDHPHAEGTRYLRNDFPDHAKKLDSHVALDRSSMLSLGPSESASQLGKAPARRRQPVVASTSKYFRPANISGEPSPVDDFLGKSAFVYAPKNERRLASPQTMALPDNLGAFQSTLEPTINSDKDLELDWEVPKAQEASPLHSFADEPCFWSQVGYDLSSQDELPLGDEDSFSTSNVYLVDDYAVSSDLAYFREPDDCDALHDMEPTAFIDEEASFDDDHDGNLPLDDPLLVPGMDSACEEDYTVCQDQDMEYVASTQTSGRTESSSLPTMDEYHLFDMPPAQDFLEDDALEGTSVVAGGCSSDLSTMSAALIAFQQGRGLLRGFGGLSGDKVSHSLSKTEAEVAGNLRQNHWLPQRF